MSKTHHSAATDLRGFTLTELLVVVGIIVLVAGIVLPLIMRSYRSADRTRLAADLQSIAVALTAYRQDFGDYPRVIAPNTGAATLGRALIGPGPADVSSVPTYSPGMPFGAVVRNSESPPRTFVCVNPQGATMAPPAGDTDNADWVRFSVADGVDGPGFRARAGGRIHPAYLAPDRFGLQGMVILDRMGNPILYYSARPGQNNPSVSYVSNTADAMYDSRHNENMLSRHRMRVMMGDYSNTGTILRNHNLDGNTVNEEPATLEPYILWSAGPDGQFGPPDTLQPGNPNNPTSTIVQWNQNRQAAQNADDVTNFRR